MPYDADMTSRDAPALPLALTEHVGYLSVVMGQRSQARFELAMAKLDLRPVHFDYLATLAGAGPMAQKDLARLLELDAARIVALTDELEMRDLVERTVDSADRRRNLVSLTRSGRGLTTRAARLAADVEAELLSRLSTADGDHLRTLLQRALELG
jgi:DNA-binding MarR family transcriptional regulator